MNFDANQTMKIIDQLIAFVQDNWVSLLMFLLIISIAGFILRKLMQTTILIAGCVIIYGVCTSCIAQNPDFFQEIQNSVTSFLTVLTNV